MASCHNVHQSVRRRGKSGAAIMSAIKSNLFGRSRIQNEEMPGLSLALPSKLNLSVSTIPGVSAARWVQGRIFPRHRCSSSLARRPYLRAHHVRIASLFESCGSRRAARRADQGSIKGSFRIDQVRPLAVVAYESSIAPAVRRPAKAAGPSWQLFPSGRVAPQIAPARQMQNWINTSNPDQ